MGRNEVFLFAQKETDLDILQMGQVQTFSTPRKINLEHNNEVWKIILLSKWVICRFQPLIFHGVLLHSLKLKTEKRL